MRVNENKCFHIRFFTRLGYPCFAFDYRGFEASEGTVAKVEFSSKAPYIRFLISHVHPPTGERKKVLLEEQIEDIVNAVSFCHAHPKTKGHPIILMGWGMAGGMILEGI